MEKNSIMFGKEERGQRIEKRWKTESKPMFRDLRRQKEDQLKVLCVKEDSIMFGKEERGGGRRGE